MNKDNSITIDNFQTGIAASPYVSGKTTSFSDMRNIDAQTRPGIARLNFAMQSAIPAPVTTTFTANASTDIITVGSTFQYAGHGTGYRAVTLTTTGTLPAPLAAATTYYLVEQTATTYKLASNLYNASIATTIDITTTGSGTHTIISTNMAIAKYMVFDPYTSNYYLQDSIGQIWTTVGGSLGLWYLLSGNTLTSAYGNGLILFNNYLLVFRDGSIDTYGNIVTGNVGDPSLWTNSWQSIFDGGGNFDHVPFYSPINGLVYWSEYKATNGATAVPSGSSGLGSLLQNAGQVFAPGTAGTYTFTSGVGAGNFSLQLPTYHKITAITLLGSNLILGTNKNLIFPWDTYSATYSLPIITRENNITTMTPDGNMMYYSCGTRGNIYVFNGYVSQKVGQVPPYLTSFPSNTPTITNLTKHNGRLYFNLTCKSCSGVWSYNPETQGITLENIISGSSYGTTNALTMGVLYSVSNEQLFVGWYNSDTTTYGLDINLLAGNYYQSSYGAYIETQLFPIGTTLKPKTFQTLDVTLATNLSAGQGVRVSYRGDTVSSYTVGATFDFATYGAVSNYQFPFNIGNFINIQFKIELTTGSSSTTTPQLISLTIT